MPAKKCVAIVGSHTRTREAAPWTRGYHDFWVFNEAACIGWPRRVDAVFQMHSEAVWRNPMNRNDSNYPEWLKQSHPFPIYMHRHYDDVPASVAYPLDEVEGLITNLYKGHKLKDHPNAFTSSVGFALALAILRGYERIEIYGVEMESDTEYAYQRDGVFFWIGVAIGRGIEVVVAEGSSFFKEPVYGYTSDITLTRPVFEERLKFLKNLFEDAKTKLEQANRNQAQILNDVLDDTGGEPMLAEAEHGRRYNQSIKKQAQAVIDMAMLEGAMDEDRRYLEKATAMDREAGEHFFARQEFEINAARAVDMENQLKAKMNNVGGMAQTRWDDLKRAVLAEAGERAIEQLAQLYAEAHGEYLKAAYLFGKMSGIKNENLHLMNMADELVKAAGGSKAEEALLAIKDNGKVKVNA